MAWRTTRIRGRTVAVLPLLGPRAHRLCPAAGRLDGGGRGNVQSGKNAYLHECEICHDKDAEGDGPAHSTFIPPPANLTAVKETADMAFSIVEKGLPGTAMPAHPNISRAGFDDILAFLETQPLDTTREWDKNWKTSDKPPDLAMAGANYLQKCAPCHGDKGKGDGSWAKGDPYVWPRPTDFTARNSVTGRNFEIVSNGIPGTFMPPQKDKLTEEARWSLAVYVTGLFDRASKAAVETGAVKTLKNPYTPYDQAEVNDGESAAKLYCFYCHGGEVNGTWLAPKLSDRDWYYGGGSDTALFTIITKGVPGKLMPSHTPLSEDTRWRLVTYIRNRGGQPDLRTAVDVPIPGVSPNQTTTTRAVTDNPVAPVAVAAKQSQTVYVTIKDLAFHPKDLVVLPGTTVVWVNKDKASHTSTENNWDPSKPASQQPAGSWNSLPLSPGDSFSRRFDAPGTSMYYCMVHPFMVGSVSVDVTAASIYGPRSHPLSPYLVIPIGLVVVRDPGAVRLVGDDACPA